LHAYLTSELNLELRGRKWFTKPRDSLHPLASQTPLEEPSLVVYDTAAVIVLPYALTLAQDSLQSTRRVRISGDWMAVDWSEVSAHPRFELYCSAAKALLSSANLRRASDPAVMSPSAVDRGPNLSDDSSERLRRWDTSVTAAEDADVRLQLALRSIAATDADYSYLQECADIISAATRPSFDDVPTHLRQIEDDWDTSLVASMPLSKQVHSDENHSYPTASPSERPVILSAELSCRDFIARSRLEDQGMVTDFFGERNQYAPWRPAA